MKTNIVPTSIFHRWPSMHLTAIIRRMRQCLKLLRRGLLGPSDDTLQGCICFVTARYVLSMLSDKMIISTMFTHSFFRGSCSWQTSGWCNNPFHSQILTMDYLNTAFQIREVISGCCRTTKHQLGAPHVKSECFATVV